MRGADIGKYPVDVPTTRGHIMDRIANADVDDMADIHFFPWMVDAGVTKKMIAAGISAYLKRDRRFETESEIVFDIYEAMVIAREET